MSVGPIGFSVEQQDMLWAMRRGGESIREMERTLGETMPRIRGFLRQSGGIVPIPRQRRADHVTLADREEISRGIASGSSKWEIARRDAYRALDAHAAAFQRARRPIIPSQWGHFTLTQRKSHFHVQLD